MVEYSSWRRLEAATVSLQGKHQPCGDEPDSNDQRQCILCAKWTHQKVICTTRRRRVCLCVVGAQIDQESLHFFFLESCAKPLCSLDGSAAAKYARPRPSLLLHVSQKSRRVFFSSSILQESIFLPFLGGSSSGPWLNCAFSAPFLPAGAVGCWWPRRNFLTARSRDLAIFCFILRFVPSWN